MPQPITQQHQLTEYVMKNLQKSYTPDTLRYALLSQGYSRTAVERAIDSANKQIAATLPKLQEKPQIVRRVFDENAAGSTTPETGQGFFSRLFSRIFG